MEYRERLTRIGEANLKMDRTLGQTIAVPQSGIIWAPCQAVDPPTHIRNLLSRGAKGVSVPPTNPAIFHSSGST